MLQTRIYAVTNKTTGATHLVESHHPTHALKVVTEAEFDVAVPGSVELTKLIESGARVIRKPASSITISATDAPTLTA